MVNLHEILQLSAAERILMIEKIWDSIERENLEISPAQKEELDRRLIRYKEGKTNFFTWTQIKEDIHTALRNVSSDNIWYFSY
jgi:putative addiction module component (TIGR02574 family)